MSNRFHDVTFTAPVKRLQEAMGSRRAYARGEGGPAVNDHLGPSEREFIEARDGLVMATVSDSGWPYVQHRGGPPGFIKVLDPHTLLLADVRGNKQYISLGNLHGNDRVSMILIDHARQTRLKLLGHAEVLPLEAVPQEQRPALDERPVERWLKIRVVAVDWNCPQGITPRFTLEELKLILERGERDS